MYCCLDLPNDVENVIKGLKQVAADSLKTEALRVEERIRQFSDEQYSKLSDLRERAFREQQILTRYQSFYYTHFNCQKKNY